MFRPLAPALALLALAALAGDARAQHFRAVAARDAFDVVAVGDSGKVWRSVTGGATWFARPRLGARALRDVQVRGRTFVVVGDSGRVWRSTDAGGAWTLATLPGAPDLRGLAWPSPDTLFAVGAGGAVFVSADAGQSWSPQASGTAATLNAVAFRDPLAGWAVGAGGAAVRTLDGGATWTPVALGTPHALRSVAARGSTVWIVGERGAAFRSLTAGASFTPVDLRLDAGAAVTAVWLQSPDSVVIAGGGGFLRRSADHGATWTWAVHTLQGVPSDLCFAGGSAWLASESSPLVLRSADGGATWSAPSGAVQARSWPLKRSTSGTIRGATFALNPLNQRTLYCVMGAQLMLSRDDGETWTNVSVIPSATKTNAFVVSPKDTNLMVAAVGTPDRIVRSTDGGLSWVTTFTKDFGEYGIPVEMNPDRPDTLYFGPDGSKLWISKDFGASWDSLGNFSFVSPCDIAVVPGIDSTVVVVGDGITSSGIGKIHRSNDGGQTWRTVFSPTSPPTQASEVPGLAVSRLRPSSVYASAWSSGAFKRSLDTGLTWSTSLAVSQTWGTDVAKDDPNLVAMGTYSFNNGWLSFDGGATWTLVNPLGGSNYTFFAKDRATILAQQSNGIYKLLVRDSIPLVGSQSLALNAPVAGHTVQAGATFNVAWNAGAVPLVRVEYRPSPLAPWQEVGVADGYLGSFAWSVPFDATDEAAIRVSDAWDGAPADSSGAFTIALPLVSVAPLAIDFGPRGLGSATTEAVVVTNTGTGLLQVSAVSTGSTSFTEGRDAFNLGPGDADTVGVTFRPSSVGAHGDTLTIASNAYGAALVKVALAGAGADTASLALVAPDGGEAWAFGTVQNVTWTSAVIESVAIDYRTAPGPWTTVAPAVPAAAGAYAWTIPNAPTATARVRIRAVGGALADSSAADFAITVAGFAALPDPLRLPSAVVGGASSDTLRIENPGTAPLVVSAVTSSRPAFRTGRTSFVVPPGGADTLGVWFEPASSGWDTTTITFVTNDPAGGHAVTAFGWAGASLAAQGPGALAFALLQNHPNPFTGRTTIRYALPERADVTLEVFNLQGQRVATLVRGPQEPGAYSVAFGSGVAGADGARLGRVAAGVYFYRLAAGPRVATRKMLVMP